MKRVIIESPYGSDDSDEVGANIRYLRRCMAHALGEGVAPYASHGLYTQPGVLDDGVPGERDLGIRAGFAWGAVADEVWVYLDRGVSKGMLAGVGRALAIGQRVRLVTLDPSPFEADERGRERLNALVYVVEGSKHAAREVPR